MISREQIRHELADRNVMKVARATGLHFQTIRRVRDGQSRMSEDTRERLSAYLTERAFK
jgi:DNA-binding LacI/PurR family transcriptional regulator